MRRTKADELISQRLRELNGHQPPHVARYVECPIDWAASQHREPVIGPP